MDEKVVTVLADYDVRAAHEQEQMNAMTPDEILLHRDELLISVGPETGQLLNLLIKASHAKNILEIGASYGYSTIWLAEAARVTGGRVVSLELSADKVAYTREQLERAGLASQVEFHIGDAREAILSLQGSFDFVLIDLWKELYIPCFDLLYPKLADGAFVAADNMLFPQNSLAYATRYRSHIRARYKLDSLLLPVGSGVELSRVMHAPAQ